MESFAGDKNEFSYYFDFYLYDYYVILGKKQCIREMLAMSTA